MLRDEDTMTEIRRRWGSWGNFEQAWIAGDPDALAWMSHPQLLAFIQASHRDGDDDPAPTEYRARPPADAWAYKDWLKNYHAEPDDENPGTTELVPEKSGAERVLAEADQFISIS